MTTYLHPGVYIEETPSGSKPIEGVATSVTTFVGNAKKGPTNEATLIHSLDDYKNHFGEIASESDNMGFAAQAFYLNGGKSAYICRLCGDNAEVANCSIGGEGASGSETTDSILIFSAKNEGEWGNDVYFRIVKPDQDALTFDLEVGVRKDGEFDQKELFPALSMNADDSAYVLTQVNGNSRYISAALGDDAAGYYKSATLTGGTLDTGDNALFSSAITGPMNLSFNINKLGTRQITIDPSASLEGSDHNLDAKEVCSALESAVKALSAADAYQNFSCTYSSGRFSFASGKDGSLAHIDIYDGELSKLLRLDSSARVRLIGGDVSDTDFSADLTSKTNLIIVIDGHGDELITLLSTNLALVGNNTSDGAAIAQALQNAVRAIDRNITSYAGFTCLYNAGTFVLSSGSATSRSSALSVVASTDVLGLNAAVSIVGRQVEQGISNIVPLETLGLNAAGVKLEGGTDAPATVNDFSDFYVNTLRKVRDVSIVVVPGEAWASDGSGNAILSQTLAHCEATKNRVLIIDAPVGLELKDGSTVDNMALPTSTYSALYYPWVEMVNPFYNEETNPNVAKTVAVAPSAFAAGMWAKIDGKRGVWKAPAGVETQLLGAAGLSYHVEELEQDQLNPRGVNCIRKLPGYGSVLWGGRTLSTKAQPEWRYVPVRRTAIMIEQSVYNGIQWAVFEPNDTPLWGALRANIGAFMNGLFRAGAFQGETVSDAYFVRCGLGDTMTQGDIDRGQVIVQVGFAPLKPAEFVIVRIQQKVAQQ